MYSSCTSFHSTLEEGAPETSAQMGGNVVPKPQLEVVTEEKEIGNTWERNSVKKKI